MISNAPKPIDSSTLQFKHLCKLQTLNDPSKDLYKKPTNLVACSSIYGLIFIGEKCGFKAIVSSKIFQEIHNYNIKTVVKNYVQRSVRLPSSPTHIDVNLGQKLLSIVFSVNEVPILRIYSTESFFLENVVVVNEVRLSSCQNTFVKDLCWNPSIANVLSTVINDGSLTVYSFNENGSFEFKCLPTNSNSTCTCWSPKGKQLVVGNYNGFLTQYLPELKAVKSFPPPSGIFNKPCTVVNVKWLSSFQFIVVYQPQIQQLTQDNEIRSNIVIVNTNKNGPVTYINYEDICFSSGIYRSNQFYFIHVVAWNLIFVVSANGVEMGVLNLQDGSTWCQWNLEESSRVVLPMNKGEETFPVGIALDYSSSIQTPIGDTVISMPVLHILTDEGLLCVYLVNNLLPSVSSLCMKPNQNLSLQHFNTNETIHEDPKINDVVSIQQNISLPQISVPFIPIGSDFNKDLIPPIPTTTLSLNLPIQVPDDHVQLNLPSAASVILPTFKNTTVTTQSVTVFPTETRTVSSTSTQSNPLSRNSVPVVSQSTVIQDMTVQNNTKSQADIIKARDEMYKLFQKKTVAFENDIVEIKNLIRSIRIDNDDENYIDSKRFTKLRTDCKKLQNLHSSLRNNIDNAKTSVMEVFAYVQEIKSRLFQLNNPGYRTLSGIQDLDPIASVSLKNIENNVNYVQGQIDKADKMLDEIWYKFNRKVPTAINIKIPVLENVYETMVKQQKILKVLKLQVENLEKQMKNITKCFIHDQIPASDYINKLLLDNMNEDSTLASLTAKALNLSSKGNNLDPKFLAQKYSKEYAKGFYLSNSKQLKLQEVYSMHQVTHIQSTRLQRLKKKSLIILSKSVCVPEADKNQILETSPTTSKAAEDHLISPVSSVSESLVNDEHGINDSVINKNEVIVSSTPVKGIIPSGINEEKNFPDETLCISTAETLTDIDLPKCTISFAIQSPAANVLSKVANDKISTTITSEKTTLPIMEKPISSPIINQNILSSSSFPIITTSTIFGGSESLSFTKSCSTVSSTSNFGNVGVPSNSLFSFSIKPTAYINEIKDKQDENVVVTATVTKEPTISFSFSKTIVTHDNTITTTATSATGSNLLGTGSSIFSGLNVNSATPTASAASSVFGMSVTTTSVPSIFSGSGSSIFSPQKTNVSSSSETKSLFTSGLTTMQPSIFGQSTIFGQNINTTTASNQSNIESKNTFGQFNSNVAEKSSETIVQDNVKSESSVSTLTAATVSVQVPNTAGTSIFGNTSGPSIFGQSTIFGSNSPISVATDQGNLENKNALLQLNTVAAGKPLEVTQNNAKCESVAAFAQVTSDVTVPSVFDSISGSSIFGKPNVSTGSTINFGSIVMPSSSLFNAVSKTTAVTVSTTSNETTTAATIVSEVTTVSSVPTVQTKTTIANNSVTATSVPQTTVTNANIFENTGSFFGGLSINSTTTTVATASVFGKPATSNSIFGTNIFSQKLNTSSAANTVDSKSLFGTGTTQQSIFGENNNQNMENKSMFSQSTGFQSSGTSLFGNNSLFGSNSFATSGTSTGQTNTFAAGNTASVFGNSGNSTFSTTSTNSPFQNTGSGFGSSATFSTAAQQQNNTGFGSPLSFQSVFKTNNSFASFGGAPTFGGSPSFGTSPTKVFGQTSGSVGFGSPTQQQQTTFENLASENTVSFGNLAQQQTSNFGSPPAFGNPNPNPNPTFGSSNFGGTSFSSWR